MTRQKQILNKIVTENNVLNRIRLYRKLECSLQSELTQLFFFRLAGICNAFLVKSHCLRKPFGVPYSVLL